MESEYLEHAHQAADSAGDHHAHEHQLRRRDAHVVGKAFVLTCELHLIACGGALHEIPHEEGDGDRQEYGGGEV